MLENRHIVTLAYKEILLRDPDPGGLESWNTRMNQGLTEAAMREEMRQSAEFKENFKGEAPSPEPPPTPVPGGPMLLRVVGNQFRRASDLSLVKLLGIGGVCCTETSEGVANFAKLCGWPLIALDHLTYIHKRAPHANFVHIRLGPFITDNEGPGFNAYHEMPDGHTYDLETWEQSFWIKARNIVSAAKSLGKWVEVDGIDGWGLKVGAVACPYAAGRNIQGVNLVGPEVVHGAPPAIFQKFMRKMVQELGEFDNVLWQLGNENYVIHATADYEGGLAAVIRRAEADFGFPSHPIGSNTDVSAATAPPYVDYIERHSNDAQHTDVVPIMVNEYTADKIPPDIFKTEAAAAWRWGTSYHLWMNDLSPSEWDQALGFLEQIATGLVVVPDECPPVTKWGVKIHSIVLHGQPWDFNPADPHAPVGANVVLDSTPFFGSGGPCNQEHPGICAGRKCEPAGGPDWRQTSGPATPTQLDSDGYLLHVNGVSSGTYTFETQMKQGATDQEEPAKPLRGGGSGTTRSVSWSVP